MRSITRTFIAVAAAGALLALPAAGLADQGKSQGKGQGKTKRCAKAQKVGYSVSGTYVSHTANTVTFTVTGANSHARNSGEIADQNASEPGVQVAGAQYTVPASDAFTLNLEGYEGADTPSAGDEVHLNGKITRTKKKCAAAGTSTADRYGAVDVRKVTVTDRDAD